jgi:hypothetical protein
MVLITTVSLRSSFIWFSPRFPPLRSLIVLPILILPCHGFIGSPLRFHHQLRTHHTTTHHGFTIYSFWLAGFILNSPLRFHLSFYFSWTHHGFHHCFIYRRREHFTTAHHDQSWSVIFYSTIPFSFILIPTHGFIYSPYAHHAHFGPCWLIAARTQSPPSRLIPSPRLTVHHVALSITAHHASLPWTSASITWTQENVKQLPNNLIALYFAQ